MLKDTSVWYTSFRSTVRAVGFSLLASYVTKDMNSDVCQVTAGRKGRDEIH